MLTNSDRLGGSPLSYKGLGVAAFCINNKNKSWPIANALTFGTDVSVPQGYQAVNRALAAPLFTSGQIAIRLIAETFLTALLRASGNLSATAPLELTLNANANVLGNIYSSLLPEFMLTALMRASGNMATNIDWAARPSSFDIAQEVMNFSIDGFTFQDIVKLKAAVLLGKASGAGSGIETFRSIDDTANRVVSEVDNDGNRTTVTLDAS